MPGQKENLQEKLCICLLVKNSQVLILEICKEHMRSQIYRETTDRTYLRLRDLETRAFRQIITI